MFKLNLPSRGGDGAVDEVLSLDADGANDTPRSGSSQSLFDFNEDASSSSSALSDEDDGDAEMLELETMEAVFDDETKQMIEAVERHMALQDEDWLLTSHADADPDSMAQELAEREMKKQKKLYNLRRQKFYELGGKKKTRNIMMRYGITHLKLLKEQHTSVASEMDSVETHPRAVSNSLLRHLKYGDDVVRIDWLKDIFSWLVRKQREDSDGLKFITSAQSDVAAAGTGSVADIAGAASSQTLGSPCPTEKSGAFPSWRQPTGAAGMSRTGSMLSWVDPIAGSSPMQKSIGNMPTSSPNHNNVDEPLTVEIPDAPQQQQPHDAPPHDVNWAYMQRRQMVALQQRATDKTNNAADQQQAGIEVKRVPSNAVDENMFAKGMRCFFELLARHDRQQNIKEGRRKRRGTDVPAAVGPGGNGVAGCDVADNKGDVSPTSDKELFFQRVKEAVQRGGVVLDEDDEETAEAAASLKAVASLSSMRRDDSSVVSRRFTQSLLDMASEHNEEDLIISSAATGGGAAAQQKKDDFVGRDFLTRSQDIIDAGFRFLFCAVDANDNGCITWDALLEYLLDATLLTKAAELDLASRDYEFVRHHHTSAFSDLSDVCLVPARSLLVVAGVHVTLIGNKNGEVFVERNTIKSPLDVMTLVPHHRVTALAHMASMKMLAVVASDSVVRIYTMHSVAKPRMIASCRVSSNARTLLWFKELLFVGTREGVVHALHISHSRAGGWTLRQHRECAPHSDIVSRLVAIPVESCVCSASFDGTMALHDAKTLKTVFRLPREHALGIVDMCYCDCINGIATVSFDNRILVWMVSLLHSKPIPLIDSVRGHVGTLSSVACVEHARALVTLDTKGLLKVWGLKNFLCVQTVSVGSHAPLCDANSKFFRVIVHHSPPSVLLPLGSTQLYLFSRRRLYIFEYNLSQRSVVLRNTADDDAIVYVGYNYVEQLYVTFTSSTVRIWEAATCVIRDTFRCALVDDHGGISAAHLHPNGRVYYVGTHKGTVIAKNFSTGSTMFFSRCHATPCIALRFCFAAMVVARLSSIAAATDGAAPLKTKAGLGDIVVTVADDSCVVLSSDFASKLTLDGVENPRCLDHDAQSSLILVGDAFGSVNVYLQVNLSGQRNVPYQVMQFPKRMPREITAITMMHGLSACVAADDEGTIGLFSLKHHPKPFSCVGVWSHVSDGGEGSGGGSATVSTMTFFHAKWLLYCGDEMGSVVVYQIRDAFLMSQQTSGGASESVLDSSSLLVGSPKSRGALAVRRANATGKSPRSLKPPQGSGLRTTPRAGTTHSPRFLLGSNPASPTSLSAECTGAITPTEANTQQRKRDRGIAEGSSVNIPDAIDFRRTGAAVVLVNRFQPHLEAVTQLLVISPENSNIGDQNLASLEDAVITHTVLLTSSVDQCCCAWKLAGTMHLGSLEQYGRCRVPITSPIVADDVHVISTKRELHQMDARRDNIRLRSRGLIRLANTHILSCIPQRFIPQKAAPTAPTTTTTSAAAPNTTTATSSPNEPNDAASRATTPTPQQVTSPLSAPSNEFSASTPRSARLTRIMAQMSSNGELILHPDVPSKYLLTVQEYTRVLNRLKKSLRQQSQEGGGGNITKAGIAALGASGGPGAQQQQQDPETLSQMLGSEGGETDYNSVLDELFSSVQSASVLNNNGSRCRRPSSAAGESVRSASTTATSFVARTKNLTTALQRELAPSAQSVDVSAVGLLAGSRVRAASAGVRPLVANSRALAAQASERQRCAAGMGFQLDEQDSNNSFTLSSCGGSFRSSSTRRPASSITRHLVNKNKARGGASHEEPPILTARSSMSTSSRPPVVIATAYFERSKTLRSSASPAKDKRLGYHHGTLEAYRALAHVQPVPTNRGGGRLAANVAQVAEQQREDDTIAEPTNAVGDASTTALAPVVCDNNENGSALTSGAAIDINALPTEWTREALERMLPDTPLREGMIRVLLECGPALRKDLLVDFSQRRQQDLRQITFANKRLRDIENDSVAMQAVPLQCVRPMSAPPVVPVVPPSSTNHTTHGLSATAQQNDKGDDDVRQLAFDALWDSYRTSMRPPPPEILRMRRALVKNGRPIHTNAVTPVLSNKKARWSAPQSAQRVSSEPNANTAAAFVSRVACVFKPVDGGDELEHDVCEQYEHAPPPFGLRQLLRQRSLGSSATLQRSNGGSSIPLHHQSLVFAKRSRTIEALSLVDRTDPLNCAEHMALPGMPRPKNVPVLRRPPSANAAKSGQKSGLSTRK